MGREITIHINNREYRVASGNSHPGLDTREINSRYLHIIRNEKSYTVEIVEAVHAEKTFRIKVNGELYTAKATDHFDALLRQLGMDKTTASKAYDLRAPMPGLVLEVKVKEGGQVQKGDSLLLLEAMKMENILKAPSGGTVKKVCVTRGDKVEKNAILLVIAAGENTA